MGTSQERLNYAVAVAHANSTPVNSEQLSALGSKVITCPMCDGTGLPQNTHFRNIEFCKNCNGRGYVSVAQPKPSKVIDFDVCKVTRKDICK